jgi:S-adenosylmethionine/arginine decarboxylase-like enzyme
MSLVKTIDFEIEGDFGDAVLVWHKFLESLNKIQGITILNICKHEFPGGGLSGIVIIGESHAAIHTWTEYNKAWFELATCGSPDSLNEFETLMKRTFESKI